MKYQQQPHSLKNFNDKREVTCAVTNLFSKEDALSLDEPKPGQPLKKFFLTHFSQTKFIGSYPGN